MLVSIASGTGSVDPSVDLFQPYVLKQTLTGHLSDVSAVQFSPDGKWLATASNDSTIRVWHAEDGKLNCLLSGHDKGISDIAWTSDSRYICSASDDGTVKIWDRLSPSECIRTLKGHAWFVFCVDVCLKKSLVASGSFDEKVKIWNFDTGECIITLDAHSDPVTSVRFDRHGTKLVTSSHDGLFSVWDTSTWLFHKVLLMEMPPVSFAMFSQKGDSVLVATLDSTLRLWHWESGRILREYRGHRNQHYCITSTFSMTNGKYVVSGSEDHCIYLYDLQSKEIKQRLQGHTSVVMSVSCHPSESKIASGSKDGTVKLWVQDSSAHGNKLVPCLQVQ